MAWLAATYRPVSLFTLRASQATSSGGRTNLVPTMYGVKMALIDAAFRSGEDGAAVFPWLKSLPIRFEPPREAVVTNSFIKIRREPKKRTADGPAYIPTIGYREFCFYQGDLRIAFEVGSLSGAELEHIGALLPRVNYFGKRGSFFQYINETRMDELPLSFGAPLEASESQFSLDTVIQYLDDIGPGATWERLNSFSQEPVRLGKDRSFVPTALPYRKVAASRGYTRYVRPV